MSAAEARRWRTMFRFMMVTTILLGSFTIYLQITYPQAQTEAAPPAVTERVVVDSRTFVDAKVTAYCACEKCCPGHADGRTAWWRGVSRGYADQPGCAVAPQAIPYGTWLRIPGAGWRQADDTGGAMRQSWRNDGVIHIDLRFTSHKKALRWGIRHLRVQVDRV